ncbi:unnamed protein product [Rhizoctonia solani]|uniref:Uncharacterized protein n=1 Tax=Rhizoctonia solani TaxID=456999 RepID=A0A8H3GW21_9AGAM|nr:unnamed protein product [Rhizoctonia solani]
MTLNNILQRQGRTSALLWKETSVGPAHDPTWTVTALIDRVEYGYGVCTVSLFIKATDSTEPKQSFSPSLSEKWMHDKKQRARLFRL